MYVGFLHIYWNIAYDIHDSIISQLDYFDNCFLNDHLWTISGIGTDNKVYKKSSPSGSSWDWRTLSMDWKLVSPAAACCLKSLAIPPRSLISNLKIIGIGTGNQLHYKTSDSSGWTHVSASGSVKHISVLKDGTLLGVGTGGHLWTRASMDSARWNKVCDNIF